MRGGVVLVAGMQQPQSVHLQNGRMGRMTLMPVNPKRCVCPRCRRQLQQRWLWLWLRLWRWLFRQPEGGHSALESCHMPNPPSRLPVFSCCLTLTHMNANGAAERGEVVGSQTEAKANAVTGSTQKCTTAAQPQKPSHALPSPPTTAAAKHSRRSR